MPADPFKGRITHVNAPMRTLHRFTKPGGHWAEIRERTNTTCRAIEYIVFVDGSLLTDGTVVTHIFSRRPQDLAPVPRLQSAHAPGSRSRIRWLTAVWRTVMKLLPGYATLIALLSVSETSAQNAPTTLHDFSGLTVGRTITVVDDHG